MLHGSVGAAVLASGAGVGGPVHVGRQRYLFNVQAVNDDNTIGNIGRPLIGVSKIGGKFPGRDHAEISCRGLFLSCGASMPIQPISV